MPVYFVYGFRWPRPGYTGLRAFSTLNDLEDCSSEYIQNEPSKAAILRVFREQFPGIMRHLEDKETGKTLDFIEQYDPLDESSENAGSQPYVFVAAHVIAMATGAGVISRPHSGGMGQSPSTTQSLATPAQQTDNPSSAAAAGRETPTRPSTTSSNPTTVPAPLSLNVEDAISQGPGLTTNASGAFRELRDKIAEGAKIGWWVVYNGDPERAVDDYEDDTESESGDDSTARAEDDIPDTPTKTEPLFENDLLGQPLPTLIPPDLKDIIVVKSGTESVGGGAQGSSLAKTEEQVPAPVPGPESHKTEEVSLAGSKSNKSGFTSNFSFPSRHKSSKVSMPQPKGDEVADPATLKEINKKEGRRYKFFGGRSEKKPT